MSKWNFHFLKIFFDECIIMTHGSMIRRRSESLDMDGDGEMEMLRPLIFFFGTCCMLVCALGVHISLPLESTSHPSVGG